MASTHTAIATTATGEFDAIKLPTPSPGTGQVLLKVEYAALNALDSYQVDLGFYVPEYPLVMGYGCAGTVAEVGPGAETLQVGDRVTAFSYGSSQTKGMQEYSLLSYTVCAKIPDSLELRAATALPNTFVTAFHTFFHSENLGLPVPDQFPTTSPPVLAEEPILIYGGGSQVAQVAIQLLYAAGYRNIITAASAKHHEHLKSLGATHRFDYRTPSLAEDIAKAVGGSGKIKFVLDAITTEATLASISKITSLDARVAILLPIKEGAKVRGEGDASTMYFEIPKDRNPFPDTVKVAGIRAFLYQQDPWQKENVLPTVLPALLRKGLIKPGRTRLIELGSFKERVAAGLKLLRNNQPSGERIVIKVA